MTDLHEAQQNLITEYRRRWHQIRTRFSRRNRLLDWYNYRLSSLQPQEVIQHLDEIFTDQFTALPISCCCDCPCSRSLTFGEQIVHINEGKDKLALVLFPTAVIVLVPVH